MQQTIKFSAKLSTSGVISFDAIYYDKTQLIAILEAKDGMMCFLTHVPRHPRTPDYPRFSSAYSKRCDLEITVDLPAECTNELPIQFYIIDDERECEDEGTARFVDTKKEIPLPADVIRLDQYKELLPHEPPPPQPSFFPSSTQRKHYWTKGPDGSYVPTKLPKALKETWASTKTLGAKIDSVRAKQRSLGLLDEHCNLYNPCTKTWIRAALQTPEESVVYNDFAYFEHYPEMEAGLPADAPLALSPMGEYESALGYGLK